MWRIGGRHDAFGAHRHPCALPGRIVPREIRCREGHASTEAPLRNSSRVHRGIPAPAEEEIVDVDRDDHAPTGDQPL